MFGPSMLGFQNLIGWIGSNVEFLFYWTISQMFFVAVGVVLMMIISFFKGSFFRHEKAIAYHEILWTLVPTLILLTVAIPSMMILYSHEEEGEISISLKVTGHQWYWSYEYGDFEEVEFESFMCPSEDLGFGETRLLEADNRAALPLGTETRLLIGSEDVIHSFTLPVMETKIDATPGRLNLTTLKFTHSGVLFGQCSELCGANHSLMPIVLEITSPMLFKEWLFSQLD